MILNADVSRGGGLVKCGQGVKNGSFFADVLYGRLLTDLASYDLFIDLNWLVGKKWRISSCHFVDKDTKCPPVNRMVVTLHKPLMRNNK